MLLAVDLGEVLRPQLGHPVEHRGVRGIVLGQVRLARVAVHGHRARVDETLHAVHPRGVEDGCRPDTRQLRVRDDLLGVGSARHEREMCDAVDRVLGHRGEQCFAVEHVALHDRHAVTDVGDSLLGGVPVEQHDVVPFLLEHELARDV
jgi:hypothetical protein